MAQTKKNNNFTLSIEVVDKLKEFAEQDGRSLSNACDILLKEALEKRGF
jgi:hypothetical protein